MLTFCRRSTISSSHHPRNTPHTICNKCLPPSSPLNSPPPHKCTPLPLPPKHCQFHRLNTPHRQIPLPHLRSRICSPRARTRRPSHKLHVPRLQHHQNQRNKKPPTSPLPTTVQ